MLLKVIHKCDVCPNETEEATSVYVKAPKEQGIKKDLCKECAEKLRLFLRNE